MADTFCPCLGDADRVGFANRSIPHWRRLAKIIIFVSLPLKSVNSPCLGNANIYVPSSVGKEFILFIISTRKNIF